MLRLANRCMIEPVTVAHRKRRSVIELHVVGIALDTRTGTPIVVLNDEDNRRALPIWIGTAEASAIIRHLEDIPSNRPMTHDLMATMIGTLGYQIVRIEINDLNEDTYYATIHLQDEEGRPVELDSRPSDAIALALRANAPIFATLHVMTDGTISTDSDRDRTEDEQFRTFLKDIKASDFKFDLESGS
jgi:uncharacterized protein